MQDTTSPVTPAPEAITLDLLAYVSGGCGKKHCGPCPQPAAATIQQAQILQLPAAQAPLPAPQPSGDAVSTSVRINGQPQA